MHPSGNQAGDDVDGDLLELQDDNTLASGKALELEMVEALERVEASLFVADDERLDQICSHQSCKI